MLILQNISYIHPNKDLLFSDINLILNKHDKIALIGNNGIGKSILLNIITGNTNPSSGLVKAESKPYYIPQLLGQFDNYTIAEALQVDLKINALQDIINGLVTEKSLELLGDDWTIEEKCKEALSHWGLEKTKLTQKMATLSGGEKTKVFLAGIMIHEPAIVLLDEPSNHLDTPGRKILYDYITSSNHTLLVVSHDRTLLNLLPSVYELNSSGIKIYGGNYEFYTEQKRIEEEALQENLKSQEKSLRKAKETERESMERQQKLDARGKKKQEKAGLPRISMKTLKNNAEQSTSKMKGIHSEKIESLSQKLTELRKELPEVDKIKINLDNSRLHKGKILVMVKQIQARYDHQSLWKNGLDFQIYSGERIAIKGQNGSGKTTLIKIILGELTPGCGSIIRADTNALYIDQDYTLLDEKSSVYEQAQQANTGVLQEHEIKTLLNRYLFTKTDWEKCCSDLSGGEKMRLLLCILTIRHRSPDIIILDEPTNNLDIQNIEILTKAINQYKGTLLVVSHDELFLKQINIERSIELQ